MLQVSQGCCLLPILFNFYSEYLTKEALEGFGDLNIGGQVICFLKYTDNLVLLAKEEAVLQGMFEGLIDIGRCYGMEMNVKKTMKMRISIQLSPIQIMLDQKQQEIVEYFSYLDNMITNDMRCRQEIKSRTAMAKAAFNKMKALFTSKLDLNLKKKLVKCYIWIIAFYGAETGILRIVDQKCL
jgi:hypothetical protein